MVATDGYWIIPEKNVDYIMMHTGERYDFILEANASVKNYWMRAETLEINTKGNPPCQSLGHIAEGILQYTRSGQTPTEIPSTDYEEIKLSSETVKCSQSQWCRAINCPFESFQELYYTDCINVDKLRLLEDTPPNQLPAPYPASGSDCPDNNCLHFINFNFEGDSETSAVNGRNFILPPVPPQTQNQDYQKQAVQCNLQQDCNPATLNCKCTHMIDIPYKKTVQYVLTALGAYDNAHPINLHGHTFHVVKVGYPSYNSSTVFFSKKNLGLLVTISQLKSQYIIQISNVETLVEVVNVQLKKDAIQIAAQSLGGQMDNLLR